MPAVAFLEYMDFNDATQAIFHKNRVIHDSYLYTRPSYTTYPHQWLWDSCFHAIILSHFDPDAAIKELQSLCVHQLKEGSDSGMVPHMTYWDNTGIDTWHVFDRSIITQPPLIAVAVVEVSEKLQRTDFFEELYEANKKHHEWFDRRRDVDGNGLVAIIHPWESGWDSCPRWDAPMNMEGGNADKRKEERFLQINRILNNELYTEDIKQDGFFCIEPVCFNTIRIADLEAMSTIATILGKTDEAAKFYQKADHARAALQERWNKSEKRFEDFDQTDNKPLKIETIASHLTLFAGVPTPEQAEHLVQELFSDAYSRPYGISTLPHTSPYYEPETYWRGNVWPQLLWLLWKGLLRYGYDKEAQKITDMFTKLVEKSGFYEYFHPETGEGLGADDQSWTGLVVDMK